ncbi:GNAT family N-acetyltransferase [Roseinatronobacter alkalisoli]|uniref:GNAT family N-acetyltransferase n=1 Tax=Roseinatronobacter alkalisoli TaxID=3028235 RepID=A0ABT5TAI5_9RHOB|nr:GNAT family N-acetyltransferase [Roseinatronobacter sp. HJB301]MDD7972134.1 GNAT family N-acetyltransferase [Roseinatronobacter sp. HJB301]
MIREAAADNAGIITTFLQQHIETSMFLLSNLEQHGIGTSQHPHATRFFLSQEGPSLQGVFGCTNDGYLMCQHPGLTPHMAQAYLSGIRGTRIRGMTGAADQVAQFITALPDLNGAWLTNRVEPLFALDLAAIKAPGQRLSSPVSGDLSMLKDWFQSYLIETGIADADNAPAAATTRAAAAIPEQNIRLYKGADGTPIGMTAVNARAGTAVQIGGVFIAPAHRGKGHASRMLAAQLCELRADGAQTGLLFAASDAAAKAYTRIGFQPSGSYRVAILRQPFILDAASCP